MTETASSVRRHGGRGLDAIVEGDPTVGILLRLALDEAIAGANPGENLVAHVVEDEVAGIGLQGEDGMAVAVAVDDDGDQQRLPREKPRSARSLRLSRT